MHMHRGKIDTAQVCVKPAYTLKFGLALNIENRRLAQLVRALGRHPRGQQFESATAYQHLSVIANLSQLQRHKSALKIVALNQALTTLSRLHSISVSYQQVR